MPSESLPRWVGRVGRGFDPDEFCFITGDFIEGLGARQIGEAERQAFRAKTFLKSRRGAPVDFIEADDMIARIQQLDDGGRGRRARSKRDGIASALKLGQR